MIFHPADGLTFSLFVMLASLNLVIAVRAWRNSGVSKRYLYALIGPLFVGAALFAHLVTFRKLRSR